MMSKYSKTIACQIHRIFYFTDGLQSVTQWEIAFNHPEKGQVCGSTFTLLDADSVNKHLSWDCSMPSRLEYLCINNGYSDSVP